MPTSPATPDQIQVSFQHFMTDLQGYIQAEVSRQLAARGTGGGKQTAQPKAWNNPRNAKASLPQTGERQAVSRPASQPPRPQPIQPQAMNRPQTRVRPEPGRQQASQPTRQPQQPVRLVTPPAERAPQPSTQPPAARTPVHAETAATARQTPMWNILKRVTEKKTR
jgi:hypothetical protein